MNWGLYVVLCWVLLAKASHFACCLILLKSCHHKRMTTHVAFPAIIQLCQWIIGRCAQLAPPLSSGINSQTLVAGLCFWFVLALLPVITFIADTSWAPSVLSVRALSASNGILPLSHSTATSAPAPAESCFLTVQFCISSSTLVDASVLCKCVMHVALVCTFHATPCTSDSLPLYLYYQCGSAQKYLNPHLSKRQGW